MLISFFNFENLKEKFTKSIRTMPQIKLVTCKINKNCNLDGLVRIWSNFDHSKVPNYDLVKVKKERL
jgi:hypothetical protein